MNPETSPGARGDGRTAAPDPDMAHLEWLATLGELAGPLVHEFNNLLNTVSLQIAILERQASDALLTDLAEIRRQCRAVTAVIQRWQQHRQHQPDADRTTDLNAVVRAAAAATRDQSGSVRLELDPELPTAAAWSSDVARLTTFLLRNALAVGGPVTVRTARAGDAVRLCVEDAGGAVAPEVLARVFETSGATRAGTNGLELAACKTIVRRLQGTLKAAPGSSGVVITATLPVAQRDTH